jgi:cell division septum initiation protein DivIVA
MELTDVVEVLKAWAYLNKHENLYKLLNGEETVEEYLNLAEKNDLNDIDELQKEIDELKQKLKRLDESDFSYHRNIGVKEAKEIIIQGRKNGLARVREYRNRIALKQV